MMNHMTDMKKDFLKQGAEDLRQIRLSPAEKGAMLSRLLSYAQEHPAETGGSFISDFFARAYARAAGLRFEYAIAGAFILILAGGTAASAAEGALPGDWLYPVKVGITEPLRSALIVGDSSKAEWEAERTVRRLEEAESLAKQGRLDRSSAQEAREHFEKSAEKFNAFVERAETEEGTSEEIVNAHLDFEVKMRAHSKILSTIEEEEEDKEEPRHGGEIAPLRDAVEESAEKARGKRERAAAFLKDSRAADDSRERRNGRGSREIEEDSRQD